jgi:hypothetical protein
MTDGWLFFQCLLSGGFQHVHMFEYRRSKAGGSGRREMPLYANPSDRSCVLFLIPNTILYLNPRYHDILLFDNAYFFLSFLFAAPAFLPFSRTFLAMLVRYLRLTCISFPFWMSQWVGTGERSVAHSVSIIITVPIPLSLPQKKDNSLAATRAGMQNQGLLCSFPWEEDTSPESQKSLSINSACPWRSYPYLVTYLSRRHHEMSILNNTDL